MPFLAKILPTQPLNHQSARGSKNATSSPLEELVDRIEATTNAAAAAPRGVASQAWRKFIEENPALEDPFARVVQAAPDIADAASRVFLDKLMEGMEAAGLSQEIDKLSAGLEAYYRPEDGQGNACAYDKEAGEFRSKSGVPCELTKVAGGGMSLVRGLIQEMTGKARGEAKEKLESATQRAVEHVVKGPQQIWEKLGNAWKTTLLLAGLAASTPRVTGLKIENGDIRFTIPPGIGRFSGSISISKDGLQALSLKLPEVKIKGLKISTSGGFADNVGSGQVALVVPVKKAEVGVTVSHEQGRPSGQQEYHQKTTVQASASVPLGEGGGKIQAGTKTTFQPDGKAPTEYSLQASTPVGKSKSVSLSAGVTGTITTSGQQVELASNPAVTASVSGKLPTLNRRLRKQEQQREERKQEDLDLKSREAQLVSRLQQMDPEKDKDAMWALEQELIEIRRQRGSANRLPIPSEWSVNGDYLVAAAAVAGVVYFALRR
jgi:hypothetical protein